MPVVDSVKWQDPSDLIPMALSEKEQEAVKQRMAALDKLLAVKKMAKYKIELFLVGNRSTWKPVPGALSIWESGAKFHGGGDVSMKICPGLGLGKNECRAIIPDVALGGGKAFCASCGTTWAGSQVEEGRMAVLTMRKWAESLYEFFRRLDHNCDFYLKHSPNNLKNAALEGPSYRSCDPLRIARSQRKLHIYPLANLIKDTASGADTLRCIYSFLVS